MRWTGSGFQTSIGSASTQAKALRGMVRALLDHALADTPTGVTADGEGVRPREPGLLVNYPIPFIASTTTRYAIASPSSVTLSIHNILGQRVRVIVDQAMPAREHEVRWDESGRARRDKWSLFSSDAGRAEHSVRKAMLLK